jgi:hypothetical protein
MTVLHQYLELSLEQKTGIGLAAHVAAKRDDGLTWQQIADGLHAITGNTISRETLRLWFNDQKVGAQ